MRALWASLRQHPIALVGHTFIAFSVAWTTTEASLHTASRGVRTRTCTFIRLGLLADGDGDPTTAIAGSRKVPRLALCGP